MPNTPPQLVAGGTIYPSRFITLSTTAEHTGDQATTNGQIIGISDVGTNYPPLSDQVTTAQPIATVGQPLPMFGDGEECLIEAGGVVTTGADLKADSNGKAVVIATTGTTIQNIGAKALQASSASGEFIRVQIQIRERRPAIA